MTQQTSSARFPSGFANDDQERMLRNYEIEDQLHQRLIRDIDESVLRGLEPEQIREQVERATRSLASDLFPELMGDAKETAVEHVVDEVTGLGPIQPLLRDTLRCSWGSVSYAQSTAVLNKSGNIAGM